jgi:alpha-tubulin suppressor-like RCC1 family protein
LPGLFAWGRNQNGQLGLGNVVNGSSPVQVGLLTNWSQITTGTSFTVAVKTNGTLWSWGYNAAGRLGLNDTTYRSSPVQIGALTTWYQVAAGGGHTLAIKTDGTLWAWGVNNSGQLGLNDTPHRSSPVQVGALTTWYQIAAGDAFSLAIKTDGTLWSWGYNTTYGALGLGDVVNRSSPVQVGALTTWSRIAGGSYQTLAIKTDGTMWSWGSNVDGKLGLGDAGILTSRSSPVQVGALTTWYQVAAGLLGLAIKTDGTMWSWGNNFYGGLGLNDTIKRSSPVQIGGLTTWSQIAVGYAFSLAIKTDGTLWSWGFNSTGQLGINNQYNRSSPVQVGALTSWKSLPKMTRSRSSLALAAP